MKDEKIEIRFFSVVDYEMEQEYLSRMHGKGWKLIRMDFPYAYHFKACDPEKVIYQLDNYPRYKLDEEEYLKMFRDCGWEYLFDFMEYHYFRKPASEMDGDEEIFCDDESRLDMVKRVFRRRVFWQLVIFFVTILPQLIINITHLAKEIHLQAEFPVGWLLTLTCWILLFIIYMIIFIRFVSKYYAYKKKVVR